MICQDSKLVLDIGCPYAHCTVLISFKDTLVDKERGKDSHDKDYNKQAKL